jgi:hypothetical protein
MLKIGWGVIQKDTNFTKNKNPLILGRDFQFGIIQGVWYYKVFPKLDVHMLIVLMN